MEKKKKAEETPNSIEQKGQNLLGAPKFKQLENGRFKCVETGHELPAHARDAYSQSKHCRLGLIDYALARNKPPLNMFNQDPLSSSKLVCKLTGVTINKSEEHMNGKRFLNENVGTEEAKLEAGELSKKTKRMSLEIGPSSFASRKKKKKTNVVHDNEVYGNPDVCTSAISCPASSKKSSSSKNNSLPMLLGTIIQFIISHE